MKGMRIVYINNSTQNSKFYEFYNSGSQIKSDQQLDLYGSITICQSNKFIPFVMKMKHSHAMNFPHRI